MPCSMGALKQQILQQTTENLTDHTQKHEAHVVNKSLSFLVVETMTTAL